MIKAFFTTTLLVGVFTASVSFAESQYAPSLAKDVLTVEAGDYRVEFRGDAGWTLGNVSYKKVPILRYTGANQTVINVKMEVQEGPEPFKGSSHGGEDILSVALEVDGNAYPVQEGFSAPIGREYTLVRKTELGPFRLLSRTTVSDEGVHQKLTFEEVDRQKQVRYLYVFMHCWSPGLTEWMAIDSAGAVLAEVFPNEKKTSLKKDITMLALYSPEVMTGAVLSYPTAYSGESGHSNFLINWPERHNKHYLRMKPEAVLGVEFSCWIKGFSASSSDRWQEEAQTIHSALQGR